MDDSVTGSGVDEPTGRDGDVDSPWPLLVALGVPVAELGVVLDFFPLAVAGVMLFGWSVAGLADDAGYAASLPRATAWVGAALFAGGLGMLLVTAWVTRGRAVVAGALGLAAWGLVKTYAGD